MSDRVPESLHSLGELYRQRHGLYGDSEVRFGEVLRALFPEGLNLVSVQQFNRAAVLFHIVNKVMRYANNFDNGGHSDSLCDIAVYAMMLRDLDD